MGSASVSQRRRAFAAIDAAQTVAEVEAAGGAAIATLEAGQLGNE